MTTPRTPSDGGRDSDSIFTPSGNRTDQPSSDTREAVLNAAATCAAAAQQLQIRIELDDETRELVDVIVAAAFDIKDAVSDDTIDPITDLR